MRHITARIKKRKPLLTFTNTKLLHSKSAYFYSNGKFSCQPSSHNFPNRFEVGLSSLREHAQFPEERGANQTRPSLNNRNLYRKITGWRVSYVLPAMCSTVLLLVTGMAINPIVSSADEVYAAEGSGAMSVSLTMNDPDETTLTKNSKAGEVNYMSTGFKVKTENVDGYNVYVQTSPGSTNKLTNGTLTIDFVTTDTPTSGFTDNTWGYAVDDTGASAANLKYSPVPDTAASALNPAYTSDKSNDERNFTLNFAAKFAADATPGHYTSGVLLFVAAGAEETVKTWDELVYMQDMNPTACAQAPLNTQKTLIDIRDRERYTVARIKNQTNDEAKCWMTQNLRILSTMLTPEDSDITENYYLPASVIFNESTDSPEYFSSSDDYQSRTYYSFQTSNGNSVYYNWNTATAGYYNYEIRMYSSHDDEVVASSSICPKGWRLPEAGNKSGEFVDLLDGLTVSQITAEPYKYVTSGYASGGSLQNVGKNGYYWSSRYSSGALAYHLYFSSNNETFYWGQVNYGFTVRCVAR